MVPSIAIALWFTTLYYYFVNDIAVIGVLGNAMVILGVIFVINSLDSLIRLYTDNLRIDVTAVGRKKYLLGNWLLLVGLVLLYQLTPFKIEWVGLLVIGLYAAIYLLLFKRRKELIKGFGSIDQSASG